MRKNASAAWGDLIALPRLVARFREGQGKGRNEEVNGEKEKVGKQ